MKNPDHPPVRGLGEKIDELENLLAGQDAPAPAAAGKPQNIPILDEVVEPALEDFAREDSEPPAPRSLAELNDRLQARIDSELEDLAEVLRGVIKKCIVEELESRREPSEVEGGKSQDGK